MIFRSKENLYMIKDEGVLVFGHTLIFFRVVSL